MMTITNNGKKIGSMNTYEDNFKRLLLFLPSQMKVITTVGYCLNEARELDSQLDEYLAYISSVTKKYEGSLEQKMDFLISHREFDLPDELYVANLVDACVLRNDIKTLVEEYEALNELDEESKEQRIEYLESESDYLLGRLESVAGVKYQRFERVL